MVRLFALAFLFCALCFTHGLASASTPSDSIDMEKSRFLLTIRDNAQRGYLLDCPVGIGFDFVTMIRTMGRPEKESNSTYMYGKIKFNFIWDQWDQYVNRIESQDIKDCSITRSDILKVLGDSGELLEYTLGEYTLSFFYVGDRVETVIITKK